MKKQRKIAKCPRCCPEGGACFKREYVCDYDTGKTTSVWKCTCCNHTMPCRTNKPTGKMTARQEWWVEKIKAAFGGTVEVEMVGRKAYIKAQNELRGMFKGEFLAGAIGANGKLELTLYRFGGDARINDHWDFDNYVGRSIEDEAARKRELEQLKRMAGEAVQS